MNKGEKIIEQAKVLFEEHWKEMKMDEVLPMSDSMKEFIRDGFVAGYQSGYIAMQKEVIEMQDELIKAYEKLAKKMGIKLPTFESLKEYEQTYCFSHCWWVERNMRCFHCLYVDESGHIKDDRVKGEKE